MRKFVVKNRKKRKYVRKDAKQPTYLFSRTGATSLPLFILAIALVMTMVMNLNVSEPFTAAPEIDFRFTLPFYEISQAVKTIPNVLVSPIAFVQGSIGLFWLALTSLFSQAVIGLLQLLAYLDPRPLVEASGNASVRGIAQGMTAISSTVNAFFRITVNGAYALSLLVLYVFILFQELVYTIAQTLGLSVFAIVIAIVSFVGNTIGALFSGIYSLVRIPFDAAASLWVMIKPYAEILGVHVQMVGIDMQSGVDNLNNMDELLKSGN